MRGGLEHCGLAREARSRQLSVVSLVVRLAWWRRYEASWVGVLSIIAWLCMFDDTRFYMPKMALSLMGKIVFIADSCIERGACIRACTIKRAVEN